MLNPSQPSSTSHCLHLRRRSSPACRRRRGRRSCRRSAPAARTVRLSRLASATKRSRPLLLAFASGISGNGPSRSKSEASQPSAIDSEARPLSGWTRLSSSAFFFFASSTVSPTMTSAPGRTFRCSGGAAERLHPRLHVGVEALPVGERAAGGEDHLRGLGRELPARVGRARLHDHRPALDRPRDIERPAHLQVLALVVEHVHAVRIEKHARSRRRG